MVELMRAAGGVFECGFRGDTKAVQNGGSQVVGGDGFFAGEASNFVAGSVNGTAANATSGKQAAVAPRVMFATGVAGCDLWPTSELSGPDDKCVIEHSAIFKIAEHCAESLIGWGYQVVFQSLKVVSVSVPEVAAVVVPVDGDEGHAVFKKSSSQQHALAMNIAAISITSGIGFTCEIKSLPNRWGSQQSEGFQLLAGEIGGGGDLMKLSLLSIDGIEEMLSGMESVRVKSVEELQRGGLPVGLRGVAGHQQRIATASEPAASLAWGDTSGRGRVQSFPGQHDRARHAGGWRVIFGGDDAHVWKIAAAGRFVVAFIHRRQASGERGVGAAEVSRVVVAERANDGDAFAECREVPKMFADLQTGSGGGDRAEFAANFSGSVGFEIESIELAGAAPHKQQQAAAGTTEAWGVQDSGVGSGGDGGHGRKRRGGEESEWTCPKNGAASDCGGW